MAVAITIDKRLDVTVDGDTYPTVIITGIPKDESKPEDVYEFVQTQALTEAGIAVRPYGAIVIANKVGTTQLTFVLRNAETKETVTMAATAINSMVRGATINVAGG